MSIIKAISTAMRKRQERGYDYLYWCIDIHGVILTPTYNLNNDGADIYGVALDALQTISADPINKIILWSSSHEAPFNKVVEDLKKLGIRVDYINKNPECPSTELCDFTKKFYFDILLDDKAGFEPNEDWEIINNFLKEYNT